MNPCPQRAIVVAVLHLLRLAGNLTRFSTRPQSSTGTRATTKEAGKNGKPLASSLLERQTLDFKLSMMVPLLGLGYSALDRCGLRSNRAVCCLE
jgi:hypothetical protein